MADSTPAIISNDETLVINIPKSRLSDFIGDGFKNKRRFVKFFDVKYHIKREHIQQFYEVISYRVKAQHKAELVSSFIAVFYEDGSSREYNSLEDFMSLDDKLSSLSISILVEFTFLIYFGNSSLPTVHEISVFVPSSNTSEFWGIISSNKIKRILMNVKTDNFTFNEDIQNHFGNFINGNFKNVSWFDKLIRKIYIDSFFSTFMVIFTVSFLLFAKLTFSTNESINSIRKEIDGDIGSNTIDAANRKIDYMIKHSDFISTSFLNFESIYYPALFFFVSLTLPILYYNNTNQSYVSIGSVSENKNNEKIKMKSFILYSLIFTSGLAIICSLIASYFWETLRSFFPV